MSEGAIPPEFPQTLKQLAKLSDARIRRLPTPVLKVHLERAREALEYLRRRHVAAGEWVGFLSHEIESRYEREEYLRQRAEKERRETETLAERQLRAHLSEEYAE